MNVKKKKKEKNQTNKETSGHRLKKSEKTD